MTRPPRVTATYEVLAVDTGTLSGERTTSPDVSITLSFDLHDHRRALVLLERAVEDVRAQIAETDPTRASTRPPTPGEGVHE